MSVMPIVFSVSLPIAVIVFIVMAITRSVKKDKNESFEDVMRSLYTYLLMIIFLILIVSSTVTLFNSGLKILLPETVQDRYVSLEVEKNRNIAEITSNIAVLGLSIPIFIYYSKLAKKDRKNVK